MKITPIPEIAYLNDCFSLIGGEIFWKARPVSHFPAKGKRPSLQISNMWNAKFSGKRAGRIMVGRCAYRQIGLDGIRYLEHRIIAAMSGIPVDRVIDHMDGDSLNNHPSNLRAATHRQNSMNNSGWRSRDSYPGVYLKKTKAGENRWIAIIRLEKSGKSCGTYGSYEEAKAARIAAELSLRGEYGLSASRSPKKALP